MEIVSFLIFIGIIVGFVVIRTRITANANNAKAARERAAAAQFLASAPPVEQPRPRYSATDAPPPPPA